MRSVPRIFGAAVAALIVVTGLVACSPAAEEPVNPSAPVELGTLKVITPAAVIAFTPLFIAQQEGFFEEVGLNVELNPSVAGNLANLIASGEADIGVVGVSTAALVSQRGKQVSIIGSNMVGPAGGTLVARAGIDTIEDLKGLRIGTLAKGTATYGWAVFINESYDLNATIVSYDNYAAIASAVDTGQVDAGVGTVAEYTPVVDRGGKFLINTADQNERESTYGPDFVENAFWGLKENLSAKSAEVEAFMRAILLAGEFMQNNSPEVVVASLSKVEQFKTTPVDQLLTGLNSQLTLLSPYLGGHEIGEESWNAALKAMGTWGIDGYDPEASVIQYGSIIDMSYLQAALVE